MDPRAAPSDPSSNGTSGSGSGSQSTTSTSGKTTTTTGGSTTSAPKPTDPVSPPASAEMKGVWISYIELDAMLKNQSVSAAKAAIDKVMDNCVSYGLNTVFFHVRANSDAYYKSSIFKPAASVGNLIRSGFDPLAYAVSSAHSRGLQLHAWVNPYRIGTDLSYRVAGADYFSKTSGGTTRYYYVPTASNAQKLILDGLRELVSNYAIDGIQYDDYFYPTGLMSSSVESFEQADYEASGKRLSVADWRRAAVDTLVMGSYNVAHSKSGVVFGISPVMIIPKTIIKCMRIRPNGWGRRATSIIFVRSSILGLSIPPRRSIKWWTSGCPGRALRGSICMSGWPYTRQGLPTTPMLEPDGQNGRITTIS